MTFRIIEDHPLAFNGKDKTRTLLVGFPDGLSPDPDHLCTKADKAMLEFESQFQRDHAAKVIRQMIGHYESRKVVAVQLHDGRLINEWTASEWGRELTSWKERRPDLTLEHLYALGIRETDQKPTNLIGEPREAQ